MPGFCSIARKNRPKAEEVWKADSYPVARMPYRKLKKAAAGLALNNRERLEVVDIKTVKKQLHW